MHTREVTYRGYQRDDGLWDIEGELRDTKPHSLVIKGERTWAPHEPIHHMHIRVTVDAAMVIQAIAVDMEAWPHDTCPQAQAPMQALVGATMGRGWRKAIQQHLGGVQGCTHLRELLFNLATAAFQTMPAQQVVREGVEQPPMHLGQCLTWDFNSPLVERVYPVFFRWPDREPGGPAHP
jgi:hypothetical protein